MDLPNFMQEIRLGPVMAWIVTRPATWYHLDKVARELDLPRFTNERIAAAYDVFANLPVRPRLLESDQLGVIDTGTVIVFSDQEIEIKIRRHLAENTSWGENRLGFSPRVVLSEDVWREELKACRRPYPPLEV